MNSTSQPLLSSDIEPDSSSPPSTPRFPSGNIGSEGAPPRPRQTLTPGSGLPPPVTQSGGSGDAQDDSVVGMFKRSSHPLALLSLYFFRSAAIAVYVLCGLFTDNYVLSIVMVVILLSMDFWNTRNVAGRTLVGLRYWNQVDEDGESSWVFESRDPSIPSNPVDTKLFWTALYAYPVGWAVLFFVSILKFSISRVFQLSHHSHSLSASLQTRVRLPRSQTLTRFSLASAFLASFLPIVALALVFNLSNVLGFTYADRDAKQRWSNSVSNAGSILGGLGSMGGFGAQMAGGVLRQGLGRMMG